MSNLVWWEVEAVDPDEFQRFFRGLFGWEFEPAFADTDLGADYWIVKQGGHTLGGLQRRAPAEPAQVGSRLYFEVEDLEATLADVVTLHGTIERTRTELGGDDRSFATFKEPTGISFGLWTANRADGGAGLPG